MVAVKLVLTMAISQYIRTKTDDTAVLAQCLWWKGGTNFVYQQSVQGEPKVQGDDEFAAVATSFATWQQQLTACGSLTLTEGARTPSRTVGYLVNGQNENIIVFRTKRCTEVLTSNDPCWSTSTCGNSADCWEHSDSAIAITSTSYTSSTGRDLDSDVELNSPNFRFTVGAPVLTDVQNTMTHEVGHILGLAHYNMPGSTMSLSAELGETSKRTLDVGSKQFICDVYAKGRPSKMCQIPTVGADLGPPAKVGCTEMPLEAMAALSAILLLRVRRSAVRA